LVSIRPLSCLHQTVYKSSITHSSNTSHRKLPFARTLLCRICLHVVACRVRLQSVEFSAYRRSSPDRQVRQTDECLRLQGTDVVVPRTLQRLLKASFFFFFGGGGFSSQTYNFSPNGCQIVWSIFFGNNEFQIHHRNFLLVDSKRMKLFAIKQSKWCKFMPKHTHTHARTHAHTINGPLSGTTRVGRYQKGKTNLDLTEARDSKWQWHQLGNMQVCTLLQTDNHASTPPLSTVQPVPER